MNRSGRGGGLHPAAMAFRLGHTAIAVADVGALAYIWSCGIRRRRDGALRLAVGTLAVEGVALVVGRGNCPLGPLQRRLGDPVPLFELVLPPRAAKAAVPVLAAVSLLGLGLVAARPPSGPPRRRVGDDQRFWADSFDAVDTHLTALRTKEQP